VGDESEEQIARLIDLRERYTQGNLRATTVKVSQDGVLENYSAVLLEPYLLPNRTKGEALLDPEFLKTVVTLLDKAGFQVHFHAIGDGAIRQVLDAVEVARDANGELGNRHHIAHAELIDPADIPRFAELNVAATFQPLWAYNDSYVTDLTVPFIGEERARWIYPIGAIAAAGGRLAFGSDWAVTTANPFPQIETAVTRIDTDTHDTEPLNPEHAISVEQAIAAFTIGSAWVNGHEDETGSIEVGKAADLVVVDRNILEIDPREISDARVLLTLFDGRVVYGDPESLKAPGMISNEH
jgi:predicted amidohydrolase YtcJ